MTRPNRQALDAVISALETGFAGKWQVGDSAPPDGPMPYVVVYPVAPVGPNAVGTYASSSAVGWMGVAVVGAAHRRREAQYAADAALDILLDDQLVIAGTGWEIIARRHTLDGGVVENEGLGIVNYQHRLDLELSQYE